MAFFNNRTFIASALVLLSLAARADLVESSEFHRFGALSTRTQAPMYLLFFGETMQKASVDLEKNHWAFSLDTALSNVMDVYQDSEKTGLDIDLELWRSALRASFGISNTDSAGIEIPFLIFSGGFLDAAIQGFHHAFRFPNGERAFYPNFRLSYVVNLRGQPLYQPKLLPFALSDIIVWNKWQFLTESEYLPTLSVKTSLKIPTGSPENATGSGRVDFGASLFIEKSLWRFHSYTLAGLSINTGMASLDPILRPVQFMFGEAIETSLFEHLSLVTQVTGNTSVFYHTMLDALTFPVLDLNVGFVGEVPLGGYLSKIHYEFGVTEDLLAEPPSVDVSFMFKLGFVF